MDRRNLIKAGAGAIVALAAGLKASEAEVPAKRVRYLLRRGRDYSIKIEDLVLNTSVTFPVEAVTGHRRHAYPVLDNDLVFGHSPYYVYRGSIMTIFCHVGQGVVTITNENLKHLEEKGYAYG